MQVVADRFINRVAELSGLTVRRLKEHQLALYQVGLTAEAADLERLIREHEEVAVDCMEDTAVDGMPTHPRTPPGGLKPTDR